ncbi:Torsin [Trinorchestia longiramus]|nr:Torsin [Trinorchestia longiramus]
MSHAVFLLLLVGGCSRCNSEPFSLSVGIGIIGAGIFAALGPLACKFKECCGRGSDWINPNIENLSLSLREQLHGQHLVRDTVVRAILAHYQNPEPKKALVISLHGDTGTGKNFVSDMVAKALYKKGLQSQYFHKFISTVNFPHESKTDVYKLDLVDNIRKSVKDCERSLFIFDEVHKMEPGLIDAIKPFIDYHSDIHGVDFRKSTFLFLSNTGSKDILQFTLDWWAAGKLRADIQMKDIERLVESGAFNERVSMGRKPDTSIIKAVADDMVYFPTKNPLFSSKGCKNVAQKVRYHLVNMERFYP